ncbi:MAG: 16S rRNA processing protein RimM [Armatimonadetes bacterium]|nr:16S rRNA processing protein RimM [Armatimonadota bacterium]
MQNETNPTPSPLVFVGEITSAFGIRGELKMVPAMDEPKHLLKLPFVTFRWTRKTPLPERRLKVVSLRRHMDAALLTVEGVPDRTEAEKFPGAQLFIERRELPALEDDAFYEADLVGMQVVTDTGKDLGLVSRVLFIPNANDVYETPVAMIPAIAEVIVRVDLATRQITVRDIPGLRKDDA